MQIWAHTLVKNEERYIWYSVMSVIDCVDRILIWDTGSSDKTIEIVKEIKKLYPSKVEFRNIGGVDINEFTKVRQEMLDKTKSDWFMILDGDEVWWNQSIERSAEFIRKLGSRYETLVHRYYNMVGDIYHYQEEVAGKYSIDGKKGHLNIRFVNRKIPGLHYDKPHGQLGLFDGKGVLIQNRLYSKRKHFGLSYMHFTNMLRSFSKSKDLQVPKRNIKFKYDLGIPFPYDFYYPEVFLEKGPNIVPSPWLKRNLDYTLKSSIRLPFQWLKRRFWYEKRGY